MSDNEAGTVVQCGRRFSEQQIAQVCETVTLCADLSLTELVATICEHLGWYTAGGGLKEEACEKLLVKLQAQGLLRLPKKRVVRRSKQRIGTTGRTDPRPAIHGSLSDVGTLRLEPIEGAGKKLFNEYLQRYHPLGYRQPFGYRMRYFIETDRGKLGCLLLSGAAKSLGARDRWIGWTESQRLQRLAWVVNLSRHLIFPWVEVRNLSSHVLGLLCRRVAGDWERRWGYRPVLLETFVDTERFAGTCYRAAGWQYLGLTTGRGKADQTGKPNRSIKAVWGLPLDGDFRRLLATGSIERG